MKQQCTVKRERLLSAINLLTRVVNTKNQIREALRSVLITTCEGGDGIEIVGTNLEEWMQVHVATEKTECIRVAVNLEDLATALRNMAGEIVLLRVDDNTLTIDDQSGWVVSSQCTDPDELPVAEFGSAPAFTINGRELARLIEQVSYAVSESYMLTDSVLFEISRHEPSITAVGTDGRRLAITSTPIVLRATDSPTSFAIAPKMCQTIRMILQNYDDDLDVTVTDSKFEFSTGHVRYKCLLSTQRTLKWRPVATQPEDHDRVITVNVEELQRAMRFVVSIDRRNRVATIAADEGKVKVTALRRF